MAKRNLDKETRFARLIRVWDYLRRNTDKDHPITQEAMRQDSEIRDYLGDKQTFNRLIKDMAWALNCDEAACRPKDKEEWKICFRDFEKFCEDWKRAEDCEGESAVEAQGEGDADDLLCVDPLEAYHARTMRLGGLHCNPTFSYEEIDCMIEGILASRTLDGRTAQTLIGKIEDQLTTKFYRKTAKRICKIKEQPLADRELMRQNLLTIRQAIDTNVQINFQFNGYTCRKKLEPVSERKYTVSPYYIVADGGRYYLLACMPVMRQGRKLQNMSIWRIDLMTEVKIPGERRELGIAGQPRIPMRDVENLPLAWDESFHCKHLHMSFDKPERITLRVRSDKRADDPTKKVRPDYTFLHDWFGDTFRYVRTEEEAPYDDIVEVETSPYGMVHWALQYSDRVEVLEPAAVREEVARKVRALAEKYGVKLQ